MKIKILKILILLLFIPTYLNAQRGFNLDQELDYNSTVAFEYPSEFTIISLIIGSIIIIIGLVFVFLFKKTEKLKGIGNLIIIVGFLCLIPLFFWILSILPWLFMLFLKAVVGIIAIALIIHFAYLIIEKIKNI